MIRIALRTGLRKSRRVASAGLRNLTATVSATLRLCRPPSTVQIGGVTVPISREWSHKVLADLCFGTYETAEVRMVSEKIAPADIVLEFGGGLGLVSTACAKRIGSDRVVCYEANPAMIPFIKRTYSANGVTPELVNALLGPSDGAAELSVGEDFYAASTVAAIAGSKKIGVEQRDINRVIRQVRPTFIIMDIEGGENELVPIIDFSGIRKAIVELHPGTIGEEGVRRVRQSLTAAGFTADTRLSDEKTLFLEKLD